MLAGRCRVVEAQVLRGTALFDHGHSQQSHALLLGAFVFSGRQFVPQIGSGGQIQTHEEVQRARDAHQSHRQLRGTRKRLRPFRRKFYINIIYKI